VVTENKKIKAFMHKPDPGSVEIIEELVLDEPTCIFVNGEYLVTLIASPQMIRELAIGHLLNEAIIRTPIEIQSIELRGNDVHVDLSSKIDLREVSVGMMNLIVTACSSRPRDTKSQVSIPKIASTLIVKPERMIEMIRVLNEKGDVHLRTRGTHAAMACTSNGGVLAFAEDVGRHNAVDKITGSLALSNIDPGDCVLLSTGRQSGEMVQKAARAGFPVVGSMRVPLSSGVRLAETSGITLATIAGGRVKVYTRSDRIKL
jgi:formate dehydrogenase accessory protein FdhD